ALEARKTAGADALAKATPLAIIGALARAVAVLERALRFLEARLALLAVRSRPEDAFVAPRIVSAAATFAACARERAVLVAGSNAFACFRVHAAMTTRATCHRAAAVLCVARHTAFARGVEPTQPETHAQHRLCAVCIGTGRAGAAAVG